MAGRWRARAAAERDVLFRWRESDGERQYPVFIREPCLPALHSPPRPKEGRRKAKKKWPWATGGWGV